MAEKNRCTVNEHLCVIPRLVKLPTTSEKLTQSNSFCRVFPLVKTYKNLVLNHVALVAPRIVDTAPGTQFFIKILNSCMSCTILPKEGTFSVVTQCCSHGLRVIKQDKNRKLSMPCRYKKILSWKKKYCIITKALNTQMTKSNRRAGQKQLSLLGSTKTSIPFSDNDEELRVRERRPLHSN